MSVNKLLLLCYDEKWQSYFPCFLSANLLLCIIKLSKHAVQYCCVCVKNAVYPILIKLDEHKNLHKLIACMYS